MRSCNYTSTEPRQTSAGRVSSQHSNPPALVLTSPDGRRSSLRWQLFYHHCDAYGRRATQYGCWVQHHLYQPYSVYVFPGAYSVGSNYAVGTALQGILPLASTAVSSMYGRLDGGFDPPQRVDYADFDQPIRASAYRCQPQCFTIPQFLRHWSGSSWISLATENQRSTIFNNYAPALAVPTAGFSSFFSTGICVNDNGLPCSLHPVSDGIFYDPPSALQQAPSIALPTLSLDGNSGPSTTPAQPSRSPVATPGPTSIPQEAQATTPQDQASSVPF